MRARHTTTACSCASLTTHPLMYSSSTFGEFTCTSTLIVIPVSFNQAKGLVPILSTARCPPHGCLSNSIDASEPLVPNRPVKMPAHIIYSQTRLTWRRNCRLHVNSRPSKHMPHNVETTHRQCNLPDGKALRGWNHKVVTRFTTHVQDYTSDNVLTTTGLCAYNPI